MPAWAYRLAGRCHALHLSAAPLLVFVVGCAVVVACWLIFATYHPEYMQRTLPSISRTAAAPPGDLLFTVGISFVAACILATWLQIYLLNAHRIRVLDGSRAARPWRALNALAGVLGLAAGVFLALLANITLDDDGEVHEIYSIVFFATQVGAFVADTLLTRRLRGAAARQGVPPRALGFPVRDLKSWLCWVVAADALLFLAAFLEREVVLFADRRLLLEIYTAAELSIALLAFAYAGAYYRETRAFAAACRTGTLFRVPRTPADGAPASAR